VVAVGFGMKRGRERGKKEVSGKGDSQNRGSGAQKGYRIKALARQGIKDRGRGKKKRDGGGSGRCRD